MVDDADRLLLFCSGSVQDGSTRWFTPGGGVRPGESHEQAALREVREETGLRAVTLSREVWRGRPWTTVWDGVTFEVRQRYFLARVPAFEVDTSGFEAAERRRTDGGRPRSWRRRRTWYVRPGCRTSWRSCWLTARPTSRPRWMVERQRRDGSHHRATGAATLPPTG